MRFSIEMVTVERAHAHKSGENGRNESRKQFIKKATSFVSISSAWVEESDTVDNGIEKSWNEVVVKFFNIREHARSTTLLAHTNMETMAAHLHNGSILLLAKINSFL